MKKLILIVALAFGTYMVSAQAPEKMSYQAVVRNATGQLVQNQNVSVKVSVLQTSATGTVVYSETLTGITNANGLVSLTIGSGTVLSGTFASIDWSSGNYYLKTETDPTGGTNYTIAGTSQLLSVPYAMYAKSSGSGGSGASQWAINGNNISNTNTGNVGIGTNTPSNQFTVKSGDVGISQESLNGNVKIGFYTNNTSAFLQTHTDHDLNFSTNNGNIKMMIQKSTGNVGIGVTPTEKLEVGGKTKTTNLQVTSGASEGKVLTSDVAGNASWQSATAAFILKKTVRQVVVANDSKQVGFNEIEKTGIANGLSRIIIPKTGFYQFNINITLLNLTGAPFNNSVKVSIRKTVGAISTYPKTFTLPGTGNTNIEMGSVNASSILYLNEADIIDLSIENFSSNSINIEGSPIFTSFSGNKVN